MDSYFPVASGCMCRYITVSQHGVSQYTYMSSNKRRFAQSKPDLSVVSLPHSHSQYTERFAIRNNKDGGTFISYASVLWAVSETYSMSTDMLFVIQCTFQFGITWYKMAVLSGNPDHVIYCLTASNPIKCNAYNTYLYVYETCITSRLAVRECKQGWWWWSNECGQALTAVSTPRISKSISLDTIALATHSELKRIGHCQGLSGGTI